MQTVISVLCAVGGLVLILFAGDRRLPRKVLPWQLVACLIYLGVAVAAMLQSEALAPWMLPTLFGGGVGALLSAMISVRPAMVSLRRPPTV